MADVDTGEPVNTEKPTKRGEIISRRPYDLWRDMDNLFDSFKTGFDDLFWPWTNTTGLTTYELGRTPLLDIADMGDHYEMHLEMPGIPKNDISIEVTPNSIEICADHEESKEDKEKNWH